MSLEEEKRRNYCVEVGDPMFGLLETAVLDPCVFGPHGSGSFRHPSKNSKKNLDLYCFLTSL
jgi:hypothetical protein